MDIGKNSPEIRRDIELYKIKAKALEQQRGHLFNKLNGFVRKAIIPSVSQFLPQNYSIDVYRSGVEMRHPGNIEHRVRGFYISLMLKYNDLPIQLNDAARNERMRIAHASVEECLENMRETYCIDVHLTVDDDLVSGH